MQQIDSGFPWEIDVKNREPKRRIRIKPETWREFILEDLKSAGRRVVGQAQLVKGAAKKAGYKDVGNFNHPLQIKALDKALTSLVKDGLVRKIQTEGFKRRFNYCLSESASPQNNIGLSGFGTSASVGGSLLEAVSEGIAQLLKMETGKTLALEEISARIKTHQQQINDLEKAVEKLSAQSEAAIATREALRSAIGEARRAQTASPGEKP